MSFLFQVSCDRPLSLSVSVHLHAPWATPACRRGAVLRDRAALGKPHGFWPSPCRPQALAAGVGTRAPAGPAGIWAGTGAGTEGLHKHLGGPHTWRSGSGRPNCQQTWVHQLRTCKLHTLVLDICGAAMQGYSEAKVLSTHRIQTIQPGSLCKCSSAS